MLATAFAPSSHTLYLRVLTLNEHHSYYSQRAILPPAQATFFDLESPVPNRPIFSAFPIPHISDTLNVSIVEPQYREVAARQLNGGSVLGNDIRTDWDRLGFSKAELKRRQREIVRLGDVVELGESLNEPHPLSQTDEIFRPVRHATNDRLRHPSLDSSASNILKLLSISHQARQSRLDWCSALAKLRTSVNTGSRLDLPRPANPSLMR